MKKIFMVLLLASITSYIIAEQFVIPKKKRVSTSTIKESIGQNLGQATKKSAEIIIDLAQIQKECIKRTKELLEQAPDSFFTKANAQKLQECDVAVTNLIDVTEDCQKKMQQAFSKVHACMK